MTSASELFCNRRSRYGRSGIDLGGGSDSSFDRISRQYNNENRRHLIHHSRRARYDLHGGGAAAAADSPRRPSHHHPSRHHPNNRLSDPDREPIRPDQGGIQSSSGNVINSEDSRTIRNRQRVTGNDRLPGDVLLARERLLERLRGFTVSGHRQSQGHPFNVDHDDFALGGSSSFIELDDWDQQNPRDWLAEVAAVTNPPTGRFVALQKTRKRPAGLTQDALDRLHVEVVNNTDTSKEGTSRASRDCSICIETFREGDVLTCLPCEHRFHSCCLNPWVKSFGDCPNCRTTIVVGAKP